MGNRRITIITYHYVRDLKRSRYPAIQGLDLAAFRRQLYYLSENYTFISLPELIRAIDDESELPGQALLLTFNDNYIDHFRYVFPLLDEMNITGCFFPEIRAITEDVVLPNHKIHYILASAPGPDMIVKKINELLDHYRREFTLASKESYFEKLAKPSEFDPREIIFIKRLLQNELDEQLAEIFIDHLFKEFVDVEEAILSKELYMDQNHIKCMLRHGMHFGIIGYNHLRLPTLSKEAQHDEIERSGTYLLDLGVREKHLTVSYPWGYYNPDTLEILEKNNIRAAFTGQPEIADLDRHHRFKLPRFDTNDFPK